MFKILTIILSFSLPVSGCATVVELNVKEPVPFQPETVAAATFTVSGEEYCRTDTFFGEMGLGPEYERTSCLSQFKFTEDSLGLFLGTGRLLDLSVSDGRVEIKTGGGVGQRYLDEQINNNVGKKPARAPVYMMYNEVVSSFGEGSVFTRNIYRPDLYVKHPIPKDKLHWFGPVLTLPDKGVTFWMRVIENQLEHPLNTLSEDVRTRIAEKGLPYFPQIYELGIVESERLVDSVVFKPEIRYQSWPDGKPHSSPAISYQNGRVSDDEETVYFRAREGKAFVYRVSSRTHYEIPCPKEKMIRGTLVSEQFCLNHLVNSYCPGCTRRGWDIESMVISRNHKRAILESTQSQASYPRRLRLFDQEKEVDLLTLALEGDAGKFTGPLQRTVDEPADRDVNIEISPDGKWVAINDTYGIIYVFNVSKLARVQ